MRVVFFGTPHFAATILSFLIDQEIEVVGVVTRPDKPQKRKLRTLPPPVKTLAQDKLPQTPIFQPEKASSDEFAVTLKELAADLFIVASYGEIIKENILSIPKMCLNVHPSLLPKYRGATPLQSALLNGDSQTGVTIMEMVLKMDSGAILDQEIFPLPHDMNHGELEKALSDLSGPALLRVIKKIEQGTLEPIPQNELEATYCKKQTPEDRVIDWVRDAEEIHNQIRALSPRPGAHCFVQIGHETKRLKILKSRVLEEGEGKPGQTLASPKNHWHVACGKGALGILEVQLEGKKNLPIKNFLLGNQSGIFIKI